jgi:hypothetical protein
MGWRLVACAATGNALESWLPVASVAAVTTLLTACGVPLLVPDDRKLVCEVAIVEKFDAPSFHENVLAGPAGGLAGAGAGALQGLGYGMVGYAAIITVPIGALIGAVAGTTCAAAGLGHPNAETDFAEFLNAVDASAMKKALVAELKAPRAECSPTRDIGSSASAPDAVIDIEKIDAGMGCAFGQQQYWLAVKWRTTVAATGRQLNETTTRCEQTSFRSVDDWFADPERARTEIEHVFAATGRRMAAQLLAQDMPYECKLRSLESGEVVAK